MTDFVRIHRRDFLLDTTRGLGGVALETQLHYQRLTHGRHHHRFRAGQPRGQGKRHAASD